MAGCRNEIVNGNEGKSTTLSGSGSGSPHLRTRRTSITNGKGPTSVGPLSASQLAALAAEGLLII
jgi:hypothetical protein